MKAWMILVLLALTGACHSDLASQNTSSAGSTPEVAGTRQTAQTEPTRRPDVMFVPTPQPVVEEMLRAAKLKRSDVLYDLGCGDGRIVVTAAKKYGVRAVGFDIDARRVREARANVKKNQVEDLVTIQHADIFDLDLSKATVVTLYLLPTLNVKLIPQLEKLGPGARILSYAFDMHGVKPAEVRQFGVHTIYKWVAPLQHELASRP